MHDFPERRTLAKERGGARQTQMADPHSRGSGMTNVRQERGRENEISLTAKVEGAVCK